MNIKVGDVFSVHDSLSVEQEQHLEEHYYLLYTKKETSFKIINIKENVLEIEYCKTKQTHSKSIAKLRMLVTSHILFKEVKVPVNFKHLLENKYERF